MKKAAHSKKIRMRRVLASVGIAAACILAALCLVVGINTSNSQPSSTATSVSEQQSSPQNVPQNASPHAADPATQATSDNASDTSATTTENAYEPGVVLVSIEDESQAQAISEQLSQLDYVADATPNAVDAHAGFISVKLAEGADVRTAADKMLAAGFAAGPNYTLELADTGTPDTHADEQWAIDAIETSNAWALKEASGTESGTVAVAVIDTGCQIDHEDIKDSIYTEQDGTKVIYDATITTATINVDDNNGHGTHVAGIVAAGTNNGVGVAGMSDNEKIIPIKVRSDDSAGNIYVSSINRGLTWVKDHHNEYNIRVVNMSLQGDRNDSPQTLGPELQQMINQINELCQSGVLVVCAAGNRANEGTTGAYYNFPSDYSTNVMGVIALGKGTESSVSDAEKKTRPNYSNYNLSGQKTKTISAPGTAIYSTWPTNKNATGYRYQSGTSMASPCVAGIAAMVFAVNSTLDADDVRDIIHATATDLDTSDDATNNTTFSEGYGYGEIEAYHAVQIATAKIAPASDQIERFSSSSVSVEYADGTGWTGEGAYGSSAQWSWTVSDTDPDHEVATIAVGDDGSVNVTGTYLGTATITATFKDADGDDSGYSISKDIEIIPRDISDAGVTAQTQVYTGSELTPAPVVTFGDEILTANSDYTVTSYSDNVSAGLGYITITGINEFSGTATGTFIIAKADVAAPTAATGLVFNGNSQTGVAAGSGYTITEGTARDAGLYTATAALADTTNTKWAGTSSSNEISIPWSIAKAEITAPTAATGLVYNGNVQTGVAVGSGYALDGTASASSVGDYTVTAKLSDKTNTKWAGTSSSSDLSFSWSIAKAEITVPSAATGLVYNGSMQTGVASGSGYTISGGTATKAGSYTATAKLTDTTNTEWAGRSSGAELTIPWSIAKANVTAPTAKTGLVFTGSMQTGVTSGSDYTLSGTTSATNVGVYTATAKLSDTVNTKWADSSSSAARSISWSIASRPIKDTSISFPTKTYTGSAQTPAPTITLSGYGKLRQYSDYEIKSYSNNVNAGTATVTIAGKGNFGGQTNATFTIAPVDISGGIISGISAQAYTGSPITPSVSVLYNGRALSNGSDYTVSYTNNVSPGTATTTATGTGNYTGTKSTSFQIEGSATAATDGTMFRLYNPNSGEHFYSSSVDERDKLIGLGWKYEGVGWTSPPSSRTPVYRMYNVNGGEHHYTISADERDALIDVGWSYEGIGWYSDDQQRVPLYRDFNPNAFSNNHNYTTSSAEHEMLMNAGWRSEGYAWYGM